MKTKVELNMAEIEDALREYVEKKTGGKAPANGIYLSISKGGNDPREHDTVTANVTYELNP